MNRPWVKALAFVLIVAGGLALIRWGPLARYVDAESIAAFFRSLGRPWWAPLAFVAAYALGTTLGAPGTALTFAGGAIFGVGLGSLVNWAGASLGALLAFAVARTLGRDLVARIVRGRAAALDRQIGDHGFRTILYLRLIPLVPFNGLNFGAGLTRVRGRDYALGTTIGIVPGVVIYTYFADAIIRGSGAARTEALFHFAIAAGALIAFTVLVDLLRKRLQRRGRLDALEDAGGRDS